MMLTANQFFISDFEEKKRVMDSRSRILESIYDAALDPRFMAVFILFYTAFAF